MAELLLEYFSEEIPARMQKSGAEALHRLLTEALAPLNPNLRLAYGPRRIAAFGTLDAATEATARVERGPRLGAPEAALAGFLRKHGATSADLREESGYHTLHLNTEARSAAALVADIMPGLSWRFPWPKSMRWGTSQFTWVRPLRRILCLLDGAVVSFTLADGADHAHHLASADLTEGHRFLSPGAFAVTSIATWQQDLRAHHVEPDATERSRRIWAGLTGLAAARTLTLVEDPALLDEVTGLVEWPVPMLGRIDPAYMDLPPEVMQVSMRENQRYFALRDADGGAAPWFAFVANIDAPDGGTAIVAGNERVLRARFADARYFWDLDRKSPLASRLDALNNVIFHARLGTQFARAERLAALAARLAPSLGANPAHAAQAALLCKADLTTLMVGEFPELQGIMGGYYAASDGLPNDVSSAIQQHYAPKGPTDSIPVGRVAAAVALADKIDQLTQFFAIGEKPSGSGDPFALRRAALGIIRIVRERGYWLSLGPVLGNAAPEVADQVLAFIVERLKVQLRGEGHRHDVIEAALAGYDSDDMRILALKVEALSAFLATDAGADLLAAYRRGINILRLEEKRDGHTFDVPIDPNALADKVERAFADALRLTSETPRLDLGRADFSGACNALAELRGPVDGFFTLTINDPDPETRARRLTLLSKLRELMNRVADFSKIEA